VDSFHNNTDQENFLGVWDTVALLVVVVLWAPLVLRVLWDMEYDLGLGSKEEHGNNLLRGSGRDCMMNYTEESLVVGMYNYLLLAQLD